MQHDYYENKLDRRNNLDYYIQNLNKFFETPYKDLNKEEIALFEKCIYEGATLKPQFSSREFYNKINKAPLMLRIADIASRYCQSKEPVSKLNHDQLIDIIEWRNIGLKVKLIIRSDYHEKYRRMLDRSLDAYSSNLQILSEIFKLYDISSEIKNVVKALRSDKLETNSIDQNNMFEILTRFISKFNKNTCQKDIDIIIETTKILIAGDLQNDKTEFLCSLNDFNLLFIELMMPMFRELKYRLDAGQIDNKLATENILEKVVKNFRIIDSIEDKVQEDLKLLSGRKFSSVDKALTTSPKI